MEKSFETFNFDVRSKKLLNQCSKIIKKYNELAKSKPELDIIEVTEDEEHIIIVRPSKKTFILKTEKIPVDYGRSSESLESAVANEFYKHGEN